MHFAKFQQEGLREPRNEAGSLRLSERLIRFELGTFRFNLNALKH